MADEDDQKKSRRGLNLMKLVPILALIIAVGAAVYFYNDAQNARSETPEAVAARNQEETARVIGKLDQILFTNSETDPTVARIEDAEVLKEANPDFYLDTQVGDYLILYPQRAVIFRESENRIINFAPIINTDQITGESNTETTPEETENQEEN